MEMVGENLAKERLHALEVVLESISVDYIAAGRGTLKVVAEARTEKHMRVSIHNADSGKLISEGKLKWVSVVLDNHPISRM